MMDQARRRREWTSQELREARALRREMSAADVAERLGRTVSSIYHATRGPDRWTRAEDQELLTLRTVAEWARMHGKSPLAAYSRRRYLRRRGWMDADD